jgi:hypothetical protein
MALTGSRPPPPVPRSIRGPPPAAVRAGVRGPAQAWGEGMYIMGRVCPLVPPQAES